MCKKCLKRKIDLEFDIANLISDVMEHNKTVAPDFKVHVSAMFYEQFTGDVTIINAMDDFALKHSKENITATFNDEDRLKIIGELCPKQT